MRTTVNGTKPGYFATMANHGSRRLAAVLVGAFVVVAGLVAVPSLPAYAISGGAALPTPLVSTATAECPPVPTGCVGTALGVGHVLTVTFNEAPAVTSTFALLLTDGTNQGTINSTNATAVVAGSTITYTLTGAPVMQTGTQLSLTTLEILAQSGVTAVSDGTAWNLVASGEVNKSGTVCTAVYQRVFGGTNCSIGFGAAGPTAPDVYDVIPVPAADLPGPPMDNAPEVITNCQAGSTDIVYPLNGSASLGQQACGVFPPGEASIGNTTSNTLDYIPTPGLVSYEPVGVVEQIPGSLYVSATNAPPQFVSISVSGNQATFNYNVPVVCQNPTAVQTISQFTYASPWWSTARTSLVYPSSVACPADSVTTSIVVTYPGPIPTTGIRFKFEGYGDGYFIVGAPGSPLSGAREASQTAYVGASSSPANPTIAQFSGPTTPVPSSGGPVSVTLAALNATQCSITSAPAVGVQISIPYTPAPAVPPAESAVPCPASSAVATVTFPANTSSLPETYVLTATASGLAGSVPATQTLSIVVPVAVNGYDLVASDGGIFNFNTPFYGSDGGTPHAQPAVGMAPTSDAKGYWIVDRDGRVANFGSAGAFGSVPTGVNNVVGIAADRATGGYWVVTAAGAIYAFNAPSFGSMAGQALNRPVVGIAATPDGTGYYLVASDGGIFSFGTAQFAGSMGGKPLNQPMVGMGANPGGHGYWEVARDGGIFTFGSAQFYGSMGGKPLNKPVVGMTATADGTGYYLVASDGGIFTFGKLQFYGSEGGKPLNQPVVGMALVAN